MKLNCPSPVLPELCLRANRSRLAARLLVVPALILWLFVMSSFAGILPDNRVVNWGGNAGVEGGIPNRTIQFCNIKQGIPGSTNVAYGDNVHDDTQAIADALALCPSNQVIYIPEGTYRILGRINCGLRDHFTIRGAGPGRTILSTAITNSPTAIFYFGASEWNIPADRIKSWTGGHTKGSTTLTLSDTTGINPNTLLLLDQLNETNLVSGVGSGGTVVFADRPHNGTRVMQQMVKVKSVDGNNVTIAPPLAWTFSPSMAPEATRMIYTLRRVGIEDLTIENSTGTGGHFFFFDTAEECWFKNVETRKVTATHIFLYQCLRCEIRDSYVHDSFKFTVNAGYGIEVRKSTGVLIENNILYNLYSPLMLNSGSVGCVVGYNYIHLTHNNDPTFMIYAISGGHGAHPMMNLYEGNVASRFQSDYYWGSSSHQTLFRNYFHGTEAGAIANRSCVAFDGLSRSNNVIGNVLGSAPYRWVFEQTTNAYSHTDNIIYRLGYPNMGNNRFAPLDPMPFWPIVSATLLRHGNYDQSSGSVTWSPSIASRELPTSMYLSGKPSWWGASRWPAIAPELQPMVDKIPAQERFIAIMGNAIGTLSTVSTPRATSGP